MVELSDQIKPITAHTTKLTKAVGNIKGACLNMLLLQSHNIEKYCLSQYCSDSSVWKDL